MAGRSLVLSNEELSGGDGSAAIGGQAVEKHACGQLLPEQSECGMRIGLIKKFSSLHVVQFQQVTGGRHAADLKSCAVVERIGVHLYIGSLEINVFGFDHHEGVKFAHGMESLVRENRSIEVKIDSGAVEDLCLARNSGLERHAKLYKTFIRTAIGWQIKTRENELHDAGAEDFKVVRMAGSARAHRGWVEELRQGVAHYDLVHSIGSCVLELD